MEQVENHDEDDTTDEPPKAPIDSSSGPLSSMGEAAGDQNDEQQFKSAVHSEISPFGQTEHLQSTEANQISPPHASHSAPSTPLDPLKRRQLGTPTYAWFLLSYFQILSRERNKLLSLLMKNDEMWCWVEFLVNLLIVSDLLGPPN